MTLPKAEAYQYFGITIMNKDFIRVGNTIYCMGCNTAGSITANMGKEEIIVVDHHKLGCKFTKIENTKN